MTEKYDDVVLGQYKGFPTISLLVNPVHGDYFSFGRNKAQAILRNLEAVQSFAEGKTSKLTVPAIEPSLEPQQLSQEDNISPITTPEEEASLFASAPESDDTPF